MEGELCIRRHAQRPLRLCVKQAIKKSPRPELRYIFAYHKTFNRTASKLLS
jgi:hypothetical protein